MDVKYRFHSSLQFLFIVSYISCSFVLPCLSFIVSCVSEMSCFKRFIINRILPITCFCPNIDRMGQFHKISQYKIRRITTTTSVVVVVDVV